MTCPEDTSRARRQITCTSNVDIKSQRKLERGGETRPQNLSRFSEKEKNVAKKSTRNLCEGNLDNFWATAFLVPELSTGKWRKLRNPLLRARCKISIKDLQQPKISRFCKS